MGLCPDRLILSAWTSRLLRRSRPVLTASEVVPVDAGPAPARWQAAVDAIPGALAGRAPKGARVTAVLSNHFVRYAVLPWNGALKRADEWEAYARHRLETVHGPAAAGWALHVAAPAPRGERIACAVDRELLDALEARVSESGASLVSVQPYLMAAFNSMRERLGPACWLAVEEPGRLTLALIQGGAWRSIRSRRVADGWRSGLPELLERESAALGLEEPCAEVALHTAEPFDEPEAAGYRLLDFSLPRGAPPAGQALAMVWR